MTLRDWRNDVAVVTGGTSGIGRAVVLALAARGGQVVVVGRNRERMNQVLHEARRGGAARAHGILCDVALAGDVDAMTEEIELEFKRVDALVTCAGVGAPSAAAGAPRMVLQLSSDDWDEVMNTNLRGTFLCNRAMLGPMLRQRRGEIVNVISSRGVVRGQPFAAAYCASKRAVLGLTLSLAAEVEPRGIRVQAILPDATDTPLLSKAAHLARGGMLPVDRVAGLIVEMMELPQDVRWSPPIASPCPFGSDGTETLP